MKNKILKITKEQAIELYKDSPASLQQIFETAFGKDFWRTDITDKVFDISSLIEHLGYDPRLFDSKLKSLSSFEKYLNACAIIAKVVEIYNENHIFNWKSSNEYKWIPYKYISDGSFAVYFLYCRYSFDGSGFCYYKSRELAEKAYNNFKDNYEDFWNINSK